MEDFDQNGDAVFSTNFFLHRCQAISETYSAVCALKGESNPLSQLIYNTLKVNEKFYEEAKRLRL